jgi:hypothetical protein
MFDDHRAMFVPIQRILLSPVDRFCKYFAMAARATELGQGESRPAYFDASKSLGKWSSVLDGVQ